MLQITQNPEFEHEVTTRVPVDGGFKDEKFKARFRVVDWDELTEVEHDPAEQLRRIWIGWSGIVDDDKQPIPFSEAMRDQLIGLMFIRMPTLRTYIEAITGAKRGN